MAKDIRVRAPSTPTVQPLTDPYSIPHKWDSARRTNPPATPEQWARLEALVQARMLSLRDSQLMEQWMRPQVRYADGTFGPGPRPSAAEVNATIRFFESTPA